MEFHQIQKAQNRRRGLQLDEEATAKTMKDARICQKQDTHEHSTEMLGRAAAMEEASKELNK